MTSCNTYKVSKNFKNLGKKYILAQTHLQPSFFAQYQSLLYELDATVCYYGYLDLNYI